MPDLVVIGLGNPLLCDDSVGLHVVRRAERALAALDGRVDFKLNHSGGFDLLYELIGYRRALIVDCMMSGEHPAGSCVVFSLGELDHLVQERLIDSHGLNLPTVLEAGRRCGYVMPDEVRVLGIEAADVTRFDERPTPAVGAGAERALAMVSSILEEWIESPAAPGGQPEERGAEIG